MAAHSTSSDVAAFDLDGLRVSVARAELPAVNPYFERATRRRLLEALPAGGVLVDVGAHVGTMTLPAARHVGPSGHVHAIEPSPPTAALLAANVEANGLENVTIHGCAAGASEGSAVFQLMDYSYLNGLSAHPMGSSVDAVEVAVKPLDALVAGRVDVVKVDVEGAELDVLAGMGRIVAENPAVTLFIEWNPLALRNSGADPLALIDAVAGLGLQPRVVIDESDGGRELRVEDVWASIAAGFDAIRWGNLVARRA